MKISFLSLKLNKPARCRFWGTKKPPCRFNGTKNLLVGLVNVINEKMHF